MATFDRRDSYSLGITFITVIGKVEHGEMAEFLGECDYESRSLKTLWDFRDATWPNSPIKELVEGLRTLFKYGREGQKTAFVYSTDVDFGIGRMLEPYFETFGMESQIWPFKNMNDALTWLAEDLKDDYDPLEYFKDLD